MNTKTWIILKNGNTPVHDDRYCDFYCAPSRPTVYTSYDAAITAAKKLASKGLDDYTIFGAETVTAVKTPEVDVIAITAPTATA